MGQFNGDTKFCFVSVVIRIVYGAANRAPLAILPIAALDNLIGFSMFSDASNVEFFYLYVSVK